MPFANWTVSDGTVDLIGPGLFDLLPGSGLYVDLDGNTGNAGRITSAPIFFQSGVTYELRFSIAGSQRGTQESASVGITGLSTGTVSLASATLFTTAGPGFLCLSCSVIGDGAVHWWRRAPTPETRDETRARVAASLDAIGRLLLLRQVHGATVAVAPWQAWPEADAAVASAPRPAARDRDGGLPADPARRSAPAGRRSRPRRLARDGGGGRLTRGRGARRGWFAPPELVAAVGPGIGPCCYEVGDELREAFGPAGAGFFRPGPNGKPHLVVRAANVRQLLAAGLRAEALHQLADCTHCRADLYISYRRDGRVAGRMISFVGFRSGG